ncbi:hypothetical protein H6P81_002430 [Aristolochia fimbriata]|uniref:Uncharacterized protein n=1 Tax=Aristolochia fimbriata TaxID=158543 RepID=A0AAV7FDU7_ARIFI|nr:hypothetical protein H6P81_002430 [Aristolochia fimbriata]
MTRPFHTWIKLLSSSGLQTRCAELFSTEIYGFLANFKPSHLRSYSEMIYAVQNYGAYDGRIRSPAEARGFCILRNVQSGFEVLGLGAPGRDIYL